jgi:hypothetical protein
MGGTSMACAVAAGMAALALQCKRNLSLDQLRGALAETCARDSWTGQRQWSEDWGYGKLAIAEALNKVRRLTA